MNKKEILDKIKDLEGLNNDEKAFLINLVNTKKKYGLVWEDKPEDVEEELRTKLPVLKEVKERAIVNDTETEHYPNHILIEGDNLHALTALTFTHEGKIDLIYIDPPYNTGNKDFIYNDAYVDKEDAYRHSKWITFMHKRLNIAKRLLKDTGVVFISIDDNEQAQLKLLCDEVFGESCFVATLPVVMNLKGNHDNYGFSDTHEYCLVYTGSVKGCEFGVFDLEDEEIEKDWNEDDYGYWKKADTLRRTGQDAAREKRPKGWFPIFIKDEEKVYVTKDDKPLNENDYVLWPINDNRDELSWTWGKKKIMNDNHNLIVTKTNNGLNIYKKQRPQLGDIPTKKPKSFFYKPEYSTSTATNELKKMFGTKVFNGPKPVPFIIDLLTIGLEKEGIILDFFAGSGTTLESVIRFNELNNKSHKAIIVTNNENGIAENITYDRNKKIIKGYSNSKKQKVKGISQNNLRYYQCDFVDREPSLANKRQLTRLATELLCIKEDCYKEITSELATENWHKLFTGANGHYVYVIYDDVFVENAVDLLKAFIIQKPEVQIKVYVFSNGQYAYAEEFEDVAENIKLAALPDAIYKAYQYILPKQNKEFIPELEEETPVEFDN